MFNQISNFRQLRLWHWRQVASNRDSAKIMIDHPIFNPEQRIELAQSFDHKADLHISAIQLLNMVCGSTTADDDWEYVQKNGIKSLI